MEQVLDIYKLPYNKHFPVVCMDESPKQLIGTTRFDESVEGRNEKREDYEYVRNGVCNIFMANEPLKGKRYIKVTDRKRKAEWAEFIKEIAEEHYPKADKITLIMDNFKTHTASALCEEYEPSEAKRIWDRFNFIYTPKHGSWLNMAEIELNVLHGQCLNRRIDNFREVKKEVKAWMQIRNGRKSKINWQFTTKDARIKLKSLYPSIND
jgi:hypothetical protein